MWLSEKQVEFITGKKRADAQARQLDEDGVPYEWLGGKPRVLKAQFERPIIEPSEPKLKLVRHA